MKRLLEKIDVRGPDECWLWLGRCAGRYPVFWLDGAPRKAHRVMYELEVGPIPEGPTVDHVCHNKLCLNPWHLEAVTLQVNCQRRSARITHCPAGHPYSPENTYLYGGRRDCRECRAERVVRHRERARTR